MTLAEKIFALHSGRDKVKAGDMVMAKLDMVLGTDVTVPLSVEVFRRMGAKKVFDPDKISLVNDHFVPAKDVQAATLSKIMREFAEEQEISSYFEVGRSGICHALLPDKGLVRPGDLVVGADSHTCTYGALGAFATGIGSTDMACAWALGELWFRVPESTRVNITGKLKPFVGAKDLILHIINKLGVNGAIYHAIEFTGETIENLSMDGRFTIANMAIEAGAKTGLIRADEKTWDFVANTLKINPEQSSKSKNSPREGVFLQSDDDAEYSQELNIDAGSIEPTVAAPYLPSNAKLVGELKNVKVDQIVIGSCTNGRVDDFRAAAKVLGDNPVHHKVRLIMIPGTPGIMRQLLAEGLVDKFVKAGAILSPPTCGPCIGGHMGVLAQDEVGLFTTNRNFKGRNGHPDSKVYLCGPEVAAASALTGYITDPRDI
ncbi:3-isopropylmalate dehydratase large subunit [bacterium]|nr:3-isopropylmalate dehydratase large subunit [bacterium]